MKILDIVAPDRVSSLTSIYKNIFDGGPDQKTETEYFVEGKSYVIDSNFHGAKNEKGEIIGVVVRSRDITEERQYAQQLRSAEERWRFALEGAQQGVWDWNMQTGECFYSQGYKKLYGYGENDLKNRIEEWEALIHPEDRTRMKQAIEDHSSSDKPFHESTYRIRSKEGKEMWIMARGMIIEKDASGNPLRMIGTHTDITEQVQARETLQASEQQYRNLFQSNPLPCWIYDADTLRFLEVNQAALDHYGYSREEFFCISLYDIYPENTCIELDERRKLENRNEIASYNNCIHRKKNGELIYVDLKVNYIDYRNHDARLVVVHDVTQRVQAEQDREKIQEELKKSHERFELLGKATSDAIYDWDIISNDLKWGEGIQILFSYDPLEITYDKWISLIHPDDVEKVVSRITSAIAKQAKFQESYRFYAQGEYRYVLDRAFIIADEGKAVRMVGSLQDITGIRLKEAELEASNERFKYGALATSDILWDWDFKTNQVLWSDNYQKLMGWELPPDRILPAEYSLTHLSDQEIKRVEKSLATHINDKTKITWQDEFHYLKADGTWCYILDKGYIIRDKEGNALRMIGAMQDITERNYYQQLLSLERQIFEMSASLNTSLKEIADTLLRGIETIHPGSYSSILLLKDNEKLDPLSAPSLPAKYTSSLAGLKIGPVAGSCGTAMYEKQPVITEDIEHDPLWKEYKDLALPYGLKACWSLPIIHSSGKVMGSFATYYKEVRTPTITELQTIERVRNLLRILMEHNWSLEEIKVAKERFDVMMKATHDLIWDWNLETNEVYRDEAGLKAVYGMASGEDIHNVYAWLNRIHPEDRPNVDKVINRILQAKKENIFDVEYRFKRDDGSYSHVYDRGMILRDADGRPIRMIGAAQDVSVRKKLEQELLQYELERQKAINQATVDTQEQERSEIGKELHDNVNQVLTTTKLYLDLALSNDELKDELIKKSTKNVISVINEIRQLSRSLMDPSIGDLGLIDSINDLIENINLTRKIQVKLWANKKIEGLLDKNQKLTIFRILQEALNNAIKHANASTVFIEVSKVKVNDKEHAFVTIADDGIGFDPLKVKMGAGLKNIQNRVYLINGIHSVEAAPGKGCKIKFSFPI